MAYVHTQTGILYPVILLSILCCAIPGRAAVSFSPPTFSVGEDGWFEVGWSGIPPPTANDTNDIVVLYATSENPVQIGQEAPLSYVYPFLINQTSWSLGTGSYKFYVPNYFSDIQAVYVRGGNVLPSSPIQGVPPPSKPVEMGTWMDQGTLTFNVKNTGPVRKVLSFTSDPSVVRITWSAPQARSPVVHYGKSPKEMDGKATAMEQSTFAASDMCTPPATSLGYISPGIQISAEMTDLEPNTRYYYRVGDSSYGFSSVHSFISPPAPGIGDSALKLFVIADHGAYNLDNSLYFPGGYGQQIYSYLSLPKPGLEMAVQSSVVATAGLLFENGGQIAAEAIEKRVSDGPDQHGIIINGDLSYAFGYISRWSVWMNNFKQTFSSMPTLVSPGNHEADDPQLPLGAFEGRSYDSQGECAIPYYNLMRPPQDDPRKLWYSTDMGPVHFVQLSTEQIISPGSEQYEFLESDLMGVNRSVIPWVIVGWHRPQYLDQPNFSNVTGDTVVAQKLVEEVEPLFARYQVDVVFSGHIHQYTRTCPVFKGTCVGYNDDGSAKAPVHLMTGNAGAPGLYYSYNEKPVWLEKQVFDFGYGELEVSMKNLTFSMFTSPSAGKMEQSDSVTLIKPEGWRPDQYAASALYDSTPATPSPGMNQLLFNTDVILPLSQMVPGLVESNQELAAACFGPQTDLFAYTNSPSANQMRPIDSWLHQATLFTFLNSTYQLPTKPTPESAVAQYTLNYLLNSYMNVNKLGNLPPGCH